MVMCHSHRDEYPDMSAKEFKEEILNKLKSLQLHIVEDTTVLYTNQKDIIQGITLAIDLIEKEGC